MIRGEVLRDARLRAGLSQSELGGLLSVTARTVRSWEGDHVPTYAEKRVAGLDLLWSDEPRPSMDELSDAALLAEITTLLGELGSRLSRKGVPNRDDSDTSNPHPPTGKLGTVPRPADAERPQQD